MTRVLRGHAALAALAMTSVTACDVVLGYDDQHDPIDTLNYCDCFASQSLDVADHCDDKLTAFSNGIGETQEIEALTALAEDCSICSTDLPTILDCYGRLPGLAQVGEPCGGPEECQSLACCATVSADAKEDPIATCCEACTGCGGLIDLNGEVCLGTLGAVVLAVDQAPVSAGCGVLCAFTGGITRQGVEGCYNCLVDAAVDDPMLANYLQGICAGNPSRPVDPPEKPE